MNETALLALAAIALVDSTSIGTLVLPLWLTLDRRRTTREVLVYLAVIGAFYLGVGVALLLGARLLLEAFRDQAATLLSSPVGGVLLTAAGLAVVAIGIAADRRTDRSPSAAATARTDPTERRSAVALALGAGVLEVATMFPYLAAMGLLATLEIPALAQGAVLAAYALVMVLPALVLLAVHRMAARVAGPLERLRERLARLGARAVPVVLIVVGVHVALQGLAALA